MAWVARAFSFHSVVVTVASGAPVLRLLGEMRLEPPPPFPLDVMRSSSVESSIMAYGGDGIPLS
jgi:hypothetical protein